MINIFKSKQYKLVAKLLENNGFNSKDFKEFKIGEVARQVASQGLLPQFKEIIKQHKMTHIKLLKATLIVLHMLQVSQKMQQNPHIQEIIRELQVRAKSVMHYSRKPCNNSLSFIGKRQSVKYEEGNHTVKQLCPQIGTTTEFQENIEQNSVSYLLGKLVLPLLHIEEKVLYTHEIIYRPKTKMDAETCWATLNLLKKYSELGRAIEEIGRYYKEYMVAMVCIIRVLSVDIKILYRRVTDYLKKQCSELQLAIELNHVLTFEVEEDEKVKQVVMLVQELETINEYVQLLYCNKYFAQILVINNIHMPSIFSTGENNLEIIFSFLEFKNSKLSPKQKHCRIAGLMVPPQLKKSQSLERVETV